MRHTRIFLLGLLVALVLAAGPARAEEIIYFTNGSTMPIRTHEVKGNMIHVDLGGDSFMAFPLAMVEKIEVAGKGVMLDPSFSGGNMRTSTGLPGAGSYPVRGQRPPSHSDSRITRGNLNSEENPNLERDNDMGVVVERPFRGSESKAARSLGQVVHPRQLTNRKVVGQKVPRGMRGNRPPLVSLAPKTTSKSADPPPTPPAEQESSDSGSGD
jgi:hypothetical protein